MKMQAIAYLLNLSHRVALDVCNLREHFNAKASANALVVDVIRNGKTFYSTLLKYKLFVQFRMFLIATLLL